MKNGKRTTGDLVASDRVKAMRSTALAYAALVGLSAFATSGTRLSAQQQPPASAPRTAAAAQPAASIDVTRLPIDLQRIERQLRQNREREEFDGVRLRYFVDVFGQSPRIELFAPEENLSNGPVAWGAPTHSDMDRQVTPEAFQSRPIA